MIERCIESRSIFFFAWLGEFHTDMPRHLSGQMITDVEHESPIGSTEALSTSDALRQERGAVGLKVYGCNWNHAPLHGLFATLFLRRCRLGSRQLLLVPQCKRAQYVTLLSCETRAGADCSPTDLLGFECPQGVRLNVSSLSSPHSASSYNFGSIGYLDGSLSYQYTSLPLIKEARSGAIDLHEVIQGYRHVRDLRPPKPNWAHELWLAGKRIDRKHTLLYGRMYLPRSALEALYMRRINPTTQVQVSCVSDSTLKNGGTILALLQHDMGKYSTEYLYSTDSALLGFRGLYNFGYDPREGIRPDSPPEHMLGRLSAGGELYYGVLNKSGGVSGGLRFTTLPRHTGFPYTMTLTLNPLMGGLASSYAVKAGQNLALCSQFDFNFYSYESDVRIGFEFWKLRQNSSAEWASKMIRSDWKQGGTSAREDEDVAGVLRVRWDPNWNIGLVWEGRIREMLFSLGVNIDMQRREQIFRAVGVELSFSS